MYDLPVATRTAADARHGPTAMLVTAPARVNLIGEHTDYNGGLVLPTTTALHTAVAMSARGDQRCRVYAAQYAEEVEFDLRELAPGSPLHWSSYVRGVAWALTQANLPVRGANLYIDGDIPLGKGLSSSAALTVATALALCEQDLSPLQTAQLAQRAEVEFVGLNCGIMDQLTIAACPRERVICIDCADLTWSDYPLPAGAALLLIDSGVRHQLPEGQYNDRAESCARIAERCDIASLRELDRQHLSTLSGVEARRARHVFSENQRVLDACHALLGADLDGLGELINASHASLRDDYEVSCEAVDTLQSIAAGTDGVFGARMVGAGFGGCVLTLVEQGSAERAAEDIGTRYARVSGAVPWHHLAVPTEPAGIST